MQAYKNWTRPVLFSAREGSVEWPFCGSSFAVAAHTPGSGMMPPGVLPFRLDRDRTEGALLRWLVEKRQLPIRLAHNAALAFFLGPAIVPRRLRAQDSGEGHG